ncbi:MAG: EVE domain-containing protein [Myxococcota bacterium]
MATRRRHYWLMKSEPYKYSWDDLVRDGQTYWDGVRNYEARNHLAAMEEGDLAFYYHSNEGKEIVGIAEIVRTSYPDPTADDETWVVVDIVPVVPFTQPVSLATIKQEPKLAEMQLVRRGRLSVIPILPAEFRKVASLGKTKIPTKSVRAR